MALPFAATSLAASAPASEPLPADSLLLLVASWCVPCYGEIARLDALQTAAGPVEVRVVPYDRRPATARMLARVDPDRIATSRVVVAALSSRTAGLPYSVMTDAAGRICAELSRPLDPAGVTEMRRRCGR
ncbi:hypothetical protein COC42_01215 [Sphingomonas spermidinifaciens]|uniref:Thioredoxin domain-containing protein n=1 Tax=Sphingomonas spermidinifaciens TaxID=1141889 RepID=A0A2A4B1K5_9SPHN|nr:hypothetical protein COC42_01215 [Sphingomonas spermidinifaciens]